MSTSKGASTSRSSEGSPKSRVLRSRNVVGVLQSCKQTVDDYQHAFFEKVKSLNLDKTDEMLLAKWFRDGLREDIKAQIPKTTTKSTMEEILQEAYLVETRAETIPEESVDKFMVYCADDQPGDNAEESEEEPEEDPEEVAEEDPVENMVENDDEDVDDDYIHGDYNPDSRYWVYDDLDQWGFGTPPH